MRILRESHSWDDFKFPKTSKYLPSTGDGDTLATQAATAVNKLIYKFWNDGDVFDNNYGLKGWANDISGSANWLYYYVPETREILNRIYEIGSDEGAYKDLLWDLGNLVETKIDELANSPREGDAYDEDGPFSFKETLECPQCGGECDELDYNRYGMCRDCYDDMQYEDSYYEDSEEEDY